MGQENELHVQSGWNESRDGEIDSQEGKTRQVTLVPSEDVSTFHVEIVSMEAQDDADEMTCRVKLAHPVE